MEALLTLFIYKNSTSIKCTIRYMRDTHYVIFGQ